MTTSIILEPLTIEAFAPFGAVIEAVGDPSYLINGDRCGRYHDLARPELSGEDSVSLSIAKSDPVLLPFTLDLMERHPLGSQAFIPINGSRLVVTVAEDDDGAPGKPRAFLSNGMQGVQYRTNGWHGVLSPLETGSEFLIVDRIGSGNNLQEYTFEVPYQVIEG